MTREEAILDAYFDRGYDVRTLVGTTFRKRKGTKRVELHFPFDVTMNYAKGGLVSKAEQVRKAGIYGDKVLVHLNKEEFDEISRMWGKARINPKTGLPAFFSIGGIFKSIGKAISNVFSGNILPKILQVATMFVPGLQPFAPLIGAVTGYMTGGIKGAVVGGLSGWAGNALGTMLGGTAATATQAATSGLLGDVLGKSAATALGNAVVGGVSSKLMGGDPLKGALISGGLSYMTQPGNMLSESNISKMVGPKTWMNLQPSTISGALSGAQNAANAGGNPIIGGLQGGIIGSMQPSVDAIKNTWESTGSKEATPLNTPVNENALNIPQNELGSITNAPQQATQGTPPLNTGLGGAIGTQQPEATGLGSLTNQASLSSSLNPAMNPGDITNAPIATPGGQEPTFMDKMANVWNTNKGDLASIASKTAISALLDQNLSQQQMEDLSGNPNMDPELRKKLDQKLYNYQMSWSQQNPMSWQQIAGGYMNNPMTPIATQIPGEVYKARGGLVQFVRRAA